MALTPSTMALPPGSPAPPFCLADPAGNSWTLDDFQGASAYLIVFMCNHCPYVIHLRDELARLAREYQKRGVAVVGINANDVENYPDDSSAKMAEIAAQVGYTFPYLLDESQEVAKAYHAACTPDFYLFDKDRKLVYRGQFDDSRPGNEIPVTGRDLRAALDLLLSEKPVPPEQKPSMGCNIKWKAGNEPEYFN